MKVAAGRRNEMGNSELPNLNSGYIRIYAGARPADADTALSGNTLLVELRFGATAFGSMSSGVATANAIASVTSLAAGTPTFARLLESDGTTVFGDVSVDKTGSGAELQISTTDIGGNVFIPAAGTVSIASCTVTFGPGS